MRFTPALLTLLVPVALQAQVREAPRTVPPPPVASPAPVAAPVATPAAPASTGPTFGFALDLSIEYGGDEVAETFFTNGESQKMLAGQGGTLAIGGIFRPRAASPFSLRGTVGIKYVTTAADNADIKMTRIPLEFVGSYGFPNGARVGAGLVHHASIRFDADGLGPNVDFDPATGATLEVGYKAIALTYTIMNYRDELGNDFNAGNFGLQLLWTPGRK